MKSTKILVLAAILATANLAAAESYGDPAAAAGAPASSSTDPAEREDALSSKVMELHLSRLTARQRGDDAAVEQIGKQLDQVNTERKQNWKKLHPEDTSLDEDEKQDDAAR